MVGSRFLWKIYAGYAAVIVVTALLVGVLVVRNFERDLTDQLEKSLYGEALLLHDIALPYVDAPADSAFQHRVWALGARTATRLTVIGADGRVLADSREDPAAMDNHRTQPEIIAALADGVGVSTRHSATLGAAAMNVALPVMKNGVVSGFVRTSATLESIEQRRDAMQGVVALGSALAVIAAFLIGLVMARGFTRPLLGMAAAARAVANGDYSRPVRFDPTDGIGQLAQALNAMTERLKSQIETITEDRNKTLAILASMVEGVVAVDREERVVHVNSAAEAILGLDAGAQGRRIWEASRIREVSEALRDAMKESRVRVAEFRIPAPSKDQVIQLIAAPLKNASDELGGAIVVLHDVSELRQLEAVRRDFVVNISHELKTPLAAIRGLVETLIDDGGMDTDTHERFLEKIRDQSMRLNSLVADLLTLSRFESNNGGLSFERLDLREPVAESFRSQVPVAETKQLVIEARVPDGAVVIDGDPEALRELVDNLLSNAIKYTPGHGRVEVRLGVEGESAVLEVQDTGIGIAPEDQGRVFERFYRVDRARSRQLGGTGLGLSIVKHVALAHGGSVSLRSAPGRGSTFRVEIPLRRAPVPSPS